MKFWLQKSQIGNPGETLGIPTQWHTFVIYDNAGQKTRLN